MSAPLAEPKVLQPNPGSREALALGCTCAVIDNAHGRGAMGRPGTFWITETCPLHGTEAKADVPTTP